MSNMSELIPIFLSACIISYFSHSFSTYDESIKNYEKREKFLYSILIIISILFVGLRTHYNDTGAYIHAYELMTTPSSLKEIFNLVDWKLGSNPGFNLINYVLIYWGIDAQLFLLFYASITIIIYFWFLDKYTSNIFISIYLLFAIGGFTFTCAAIKQCTAVALCLVATDRFINKKNIRFILWILIAISIHPYALMYAFIPLLTFKPWTKKTFWMLGIFFVLGIGLEFLLGRVIDVTTLLGEEYTTESFKEEGVSPFRLAVCAVPLILSFIMKNQIDDIEYNKNTNLILNLSMLNAEIMFVGLFGTANYFARLANYFLIFQALSLPFLFKHVNKKQKGIFTFTALVCYFCYFYYENAIARPFNNDFDKIKISEFINQYLLNKF